jgi:acyl-[acyl-carrier-protein]-phospholipid O-acyltransferase/long-chain-fatty-acid--[acyl-carrier-protein] ligase
MILHHEFVKTAKKFSKKMAIMDKTTGKDVPYARALIASLILAKKFKKYDERYMGVMIPTSAGCFLTNLGILMAGKVPAMINYSTGAAENCEYAQNKCGFKTIITSRALLEKIDCRMVDGMVCIEDIMKKISTGDKLSAALKSKLPTKMITKSFPSAETDDDVVILFTSGSEKEPKAVQLTHKNISSNMKAAIEVFSLTDEDIIMSILPLFHVFGQSVNFWLPLMLGSTAVTYANPIDYKTIPKLIKEHKITMIAGTPIFFAGYLRESNPGDFESLRVIVAGADKVSDWLRQGFKEKHGKVLLEGYGTTETSPVISANTFESSRSGSIGIPFPGVQVKITDIITGEELPTGGEGKILTKGDHVMKGYYDDIEETSMRLKDGWYDTGDMGAFDKDGFLWHRGRLKRFVKIGGEMVSLVKTESVLEQVLPEGTSCCVVEIPDPLKGARLAAAVTTEVNDREMIKKLSGKLPPIAIPSQFILFDELPKMGTGKVDFRTTTELVRKKLGK